MLRIAICDDDDFICAEIEDFILSHKNIIRTQVETNVFLSGEKLLYFIENEHAFDLIFLDIELGMLTGLDVGREIRNGFEDYLSKIVFISSKTGYEMELFDVQPLHFLKKPLEKESLLDCIRLAVKISEKENNFFEYQIKQIINRVAFKEILYFESNLKKIKIVTMNGVDFFNGSLENIKRRLPSVFVHSHGSFIVNFNYIKRITGDKLLMTNGETIPVSRRYYKNIQEVHLAVTREGKNVNL